MQNPLRLLSLAAALLVMAGCSRPREVADASLEALVTTPAQANWAALAPQAALIQLPGMAPAAVREKRSPAGMTQEIALSGRPGDRATLAVHDQDAPAGLYPGKPSESGIKTELAAEFAGKTFRIVTQPRRNAYGSYGLAVSASGGERCVYAWQWLDEQQLRRRADLGGSVSWRVRLCRTRQSLDEMAAVLDGIEIAPSSDIVALAPARPAIRPVARQRAVHRQSPRVAIRAQQLPQPSSDGSRHYLAPVEAPRSAGSGVAAAMLDTSLPAAAYRGPQRFSGPQATQRSAVLVPSPN